MPIKHLENIFPFIMFTGFPVVSLAKTCAEIENETISRKHHTTIEQSLFGLNSKNENT